MASKVQKFIDNWGQTTSEVCDALGYDENTSDDLLILNYFWEGVSEVWLPISSPLYTTKEQKIADDLRL